jgi:hypothetical protein
MSSHNVVKILFNTFSTSNKLNFCSIILQKNSAQDRTNKESSLSRLCQILVFSTQEAENKYADSPFSRSRPIRNLSRTEDRYIHVSSV